MPPRATWTGQLRISLVAFPVRLYSAVSSASRVSMNQLHKDCGRRLRQQMVCPEHGAVERTDIVKGYEYEKDKYVTIDEADLEKVRLDTTRTIDILRFVSADELDPLYEESAHYVGPDGAMAEEAFRVVREALRQSGKVGIGRVVIAGRERIVALKPQDRGFVLSTLRSAEEVRAAGPYFEGIKDAEISPDQLQLAAQLIESKSASLDISSFQDRYQHSLMEIIKAKIAGAEPVVSPEAEVGQVINLMEALKRSLEQEPVKKPAARSVKTAAKAKRARKSG